MPREHEHHGFRKESQGEGGRLSTKGHISPATLEHYLKGVEYPASKQDLIQKAKSNNAPREVIQLIDKFEMDEFNSPIDISKAFKQMK